MVRGVFYGWARWVGRKDETPRLLWVSRVGHLRIAVILTTWPHLDYPSTPLTVHLIASRTII